MRRRQFEGFLAQLDSFEESKVELEQYATTPQLAADILLAIDNDVGLERKTLADLGCGCGVLMLGASLLGSTYLVGFDIDEDALEICSRNIEDMEPDSLVDLVNVDVTQSVPACFNGRFDVVIMNPPFGTKNNAGIDMKFVEKGLSLLGESGVLYSLHKSSTRDFILKTASKFEAKAECVAELRWNLENTYKFHKKKSVDIQVDLIKFVKA
ncbi:hypothetical protein L596_025216 [Steinernema carpocapsae]|uniref:Methyltransferase-like protein 5 n=1 Tax=Steinernema carpocapsae TaxID=34508 RepID=A0A4U5M759_STECR|nr:hypothetical protein L596_025216 [Steinernema carpocapsae]